MSLHNIVIDSKNNLTVDDKHIHYTYLEFTKDINEIPVCHIAIPVTKAHIDAIAELEIDLDIKGLTEAIMAIQFFYKLDDDFRRAIRASAKSVIDEVRSANKMDLLTNYELAKMIVERIFIGER